MKQFNFNIEEQLPYPREKEQIYFWAKKWGVSVDQINEAIIETGSIDIMEIRRYFVNKGFIFSFLKWSNYLKYLWKLK